MTGRSFEPPSAIRYDQNDDADIEDLEPERFTDPAVEETDLPRPLNWRTLRAEDAGYEWFALDEWVNWLRREFALPAAVIPPAWHRHPELVWELSALHLHWLSAYDPGQHASAPIGWLVDFHAAQARLREWVALSGTRLDRDRPARQTAWPGEETEPAATEVPIVDRAEDFAAFVIADAQRRAQAEAAGACDGKTDLTVEA
ncbi:MAG: hypothetical protein ACYCU0_02400 [Solirubrobacteraceae bacterium]